MPEVEKNMYCDCCGTVARIIYDPDDVPAALPDWCPFCGEEIGTYVEDEDWEELEEAWIDFIR